MHDYGLEAFGFPKKEPRHVASAYLLGILEIESDEILKPVDYVIAFLWGNQGRRVAELFGFGGVKDWPGNPEVYSWVFEDGVYKPEERQISCGDSLVVLGREEDQRRKTKSCDEWLCRTPSPNLKDLRSSLEITGYEIPREYFRQAKVPKRRHK